MSQNQSKRVEIDIFTMFCYFNLEMTDPIFGQCWAALYTVDYHWSNSGSISRVFWDDSTAIISKIDYKSKIPKYNIPNTSCIKNIIIICQEE